MASATHFKFVWRNSNSQLAQILKKIKTANINVKNRVYHTVVRLTVIKQQISFVVWPPWGSLTPQLTEAAIK